MRNFVKIRKLILSGTKCPKLGIWAHNFGKQILDLKSAPSKQPTCYILLKDQKNYAFWPKRPKCGHLWSQFWKTSVKFEIITFEIGYKGNFVKIRNLIFFDPKCSKFWKANVRFEIITFKIGYMRNFVKVSKLIIFGPKCPKLGICAQNFGKQV